MIGPRGYIFSRREVARHKCVGCGVNVIKIGDYCMLQPDLWKRKLHLGWDDNLCVACIEKRLGRKLGPGIVDFITCPSVKGYGISATLMSRIVGDGVRLKSGEVVDPESKRGKAELRKRATDRQ